MCTPALLMLASVSVSVSVWCDTARPRTVRLASLLPPLAGCRELSLCPAVLPLARRCCVVSDSAAATTVNSVPCLLFVSSSSPAAVISGCDKSSAFVVPGHFAATAAGGTACARLCTHF